MKMTSLLLGAMLLFGGLKSASALEIRIGGGEERRGGHFETRVETIIVEPAHYEEYVVPAVTETRVDANGNTYVVVITPSYVKRVFVPAKTRDVLVTVWVDDDGGRCYYHNGIFFSWGRHSHYRGHGHHDHHHHKHHKHQHHKHHK